MTHDNDADQKINQFDEALQRFLYEPYDMEGDKHLEEAISGCWVQNLDSLLAHLDSVVDRITQMTDGTYPLDDIVDERIARWAKAIYPHVEWAMTTGEVLV